MKASQMITFALVNEFYVRETNSPKNRNRACSEYMCHALSDSQHAIGASNYDVRFAQSQIMNEFEDELTLFTYLSRNDKKYKNYKSRWGGDSKACFNLRVKWFEQLVIRLEAQGL